MHLRFKTTQPILGRDGRACHPVRFYWSFHQPVLCIWLPLVLGDAMRKDKALKLALEALETADEIEFWNKRKEALTAIQEALAQPVQPEQESAFGWIKQSELRQARLYGGSVTLWLEKHDCDFPVYTTPPAAQRPIHITWDERGVRTVNGVPDDAQPAQEPPPEWALIKNILDAYGFEAISFVADWKEALAQPVQPPQRPWVGLTEQDVQEIHQELLAAAIEAKLKEKNT